MPDKPLQVIHYTIKSHVAADDWKKNMEELLAIVFGVERFESYLYGRKFKVAPPRNKAGVQRFVGMANSLSPYCPNLSTIIRPLTQLTKSDTPFMWAQAQEDAFSNAKHLISTAPVLKYHELSKPVTLQVDASEEGGVVSSFSPIVKDASNL